MKHNEKFVLIPYTEYNKIIAAQTVSTNVPAVKSDVVDTQKGMSPSSEQFNVDDFINYVRECEGSSCLPSHKIGGESSNPTINTSSIDPTTKKIKREWLTL